jgi:hypothetical protein
VASVWRSNRNLMRVKLTPESISFAIAEGTEIFKNSRSINYRDTQQTKINNSLRGAFGQQAFIEATSGHRVTVEECPSFAYDVKASNEAIHAYCGWTLPLEMAAARVEVKTTRIGHLTKWISFNDQMFKHVTRCATAGMLDYVIFYGVQNEDLKNYEADVSLLGIISAKVLTQEFTGTDKERRPSLQNKGDSFLNKNSINRQNLGRIFL